MAELKIGHLNETYYGPSIPPPETSNGRVAARLPRVSDHYSLICAVFKAFTIVLIALGIIAVVLWLVYQPDNLKADVESVSLTRFDLASNGTLYYNLTVDVSIRNPNKKMDILYERVEALALYSGDRFGYMRYPRMRQARKSTMTLRPSFHGRGLLVGAAATTFRREKEEGFFSIHVELYTRVRLKIIIVNSVEYRPDIDCYLRVPDPSNATSVAQGFTRTECHVDDFS